ncbi:BlaI/MecI/CopY family transcriptional regulator [Streptacidiphilus sp. MAP5-52]|uniref:BlaI/MecI/CopY family transcriptional regulator n=2 Tax=Streptacidiphilus TaxID=228398 RepID=UPI0035176589
MNERRQMGALEAEVLELLQSSSEAMTPGHVLTRLGDTLAYSTVVTVLTRMHDKGLLGRVKQGRAFAYRPVADRHGLTARRMRQALDADPDRHAVLAQFIGDLSTGDEEILRHLLGERQL